MMHTLLLRASTVPPAHDPKRGTRRSVRFPYSSRVDVEGYDGETFGATDLSTCGVRLKSPRRLGGQGLVVLVFLKRNISVQGVVRHETPAPDSGWDIGVQFLQPQPELLAVALSVSQAGN